MIIHLVFFGNNTYKIGVAGDRFESDLESSFRNYPKYKIIYSRICDKVTAAKLEAKVLNSVEKIDASKWLLGKDGKPVSGSKTKCFTSNNIEEVVTLLYEDTLYLNLFKSGVHTWVGYIQPNINYDAEHTLAIQDFVKLKAFLVHAVDAVFTTDLVSFKWKGNIKGLFYRKETFYLSKEGDFYVRDQRNVVFKLPVTKSQLKKLCNLVPNTFQSENVELYIESLLKQEQTLFVYFIKEPNFYKMIVRVKPSYFPECETEVCATARQIKEWKKYFNIIKVENGVTFFTCSILDSLIRAEYVPLIISVTEEGFSLDSTGIVIKNCIIPSNKLEELKSINNLYNLLEEVNKCSIA